jgi:hypothetical protein
LEETDFLEPMQNTRLRCPDETVAGAHGYRIDVSLGSAGTAPVEPAELEIHGTAFVILLETKEFTNSNDRRQFFPPAKTQDQHNRKPRKNQ